MTSPARNPALNAAEPESIQATTTPSQSFGRPDCRRVFGLISESVTLLRMSMDSTPHSSLVASLSVIEAHARTGRGEFNPVGSDSKMKFDTSSCAVDSTTNVSSKSSDAPTDTDWLEDAGSKNSQKKSTPFWRAAVRKRSCSDW